MTSWLASLPEPGEGEHLPRGVALPGRLLSDVHTAQWTHPKATVTQWTHPNAAITPTSYQEPP